MKKGFYMKMNKYATSVLYKIYAKIKLSLQITSDRLIFQADHRLVKTEMLPPQVRSKLYCICDPILWYYIKNPDTQGCTDSFTNSVITPFIKKARQKMKD